MSDSETAIPSAPCRADHHVPVLKSRDLGSTRAAAAALGLVLGAGGEMMVRIGFCTYVLLEEAGCRCPRGSWPGQACPCSRSRLPVLGCKPPEVAACELALERGAVSVGKMICSGPDCLFLPEYSCTWCRNRRFEMIWQRWAETGDCSEVEMEAAEGGEVGGMVWLFGRKAAFLAPRETYPDAGREEVVCWASSSPARSCTSVRRRRSPSLLSG